MGDFFVPSKFQKFQIRIFKNADFLYPASWAFFSKIQKFQIRIFKNAEFLYPFVDRANSNKRVFDVANAIKNPKQLPNKNILPFGTYINNKQAAALKHTIRSNNTDPLRQAALIPDTPFIAGIDNRRVGRPRGKWVIKTYEHIWTYHNFGTKQQWKTDLKAGRINQNILRMQPSIINRTI